jgi:nitroimidazol reductase NimA-like FMN-containing flavoprotein (pyridoxamine 5'-phosphate oxidase superfamily)
VRTIPGKFSIEYESAIISGTASEVTDKEEKIHALELISRRYDPGGMANFDAMARKSLDVTAIWKIHIDEISGKRKKLDKDGKEMKFGRMA